MRMENPKDRFRGLAAKPWPQLLAQTYAAAVLVWFPWCAFGYLQIAQTKLAAFLGTTLLAGVLLAVVVPEKMDARRLKEQGIAAAAYAAATLVSVLLSGNVAAALWGSGGYLGGFVLVAGALLACMGIAAFLPDADGLQLPFIISGAGVALLGVLNNFGADPLGFRAAIQPEQYNLFFSTIGNADYFSAFLCLWLPLAMHRCAAAEAAGERLVAFLCAEVGFLAMASLDSGLTALGLAGAAFLLLLALPLTARQLTHYALLAAGWAAAQWLMGSFAARWPLLRTEHPFAALRDPRLAGATVLVLLLLSVGFAVLERRYPGKMYKTQQRVFCGAVLLLCMALLVLANGFSVSFGGLDNFLNLGADWATGRGAIWANVWYSFTQGTPLQWLFGRGPGMLHAALAGIPSLPYALTDTIGAHNEYLELLLTTGVVGLAAYLAFLGTVLHPARRVLVGDPAKRGWLFCAAAYMVQAFFNNRVTAVFPIFVAVLGVLMVQQKGAKPCRILLPAALVLAACGMALGKVLLHYLFI